jgi:hypothetical protein
LQYFLFIFYTILCIYAFKVYNVNRNTGISFNILSILFIVKLIAGVINQYIQNHSYVSNDSQGSFYQGFYELNLFREKPVMMLKYWLFSWEDIGNHLNIFKQENTVYWGTLGRLVNDRFMLVCTLLSFGNYYVNIIFYNALFFIGQLYLFKIFYQLQPEKKWFLILVIFLLPSSLYWGTGMNKDGFILTSIGFIVYATTKFFEQKSLKYIFIILGSLTLMLCVRNFYFLCFLPFYILWLLFYKSQKVFYYFTFVFLIAGTAFLFSSKLSSINFLDIVVHKQQEFLSAKGYSDMLTPELNNTPSSFIKHFPTAISHGFLSPTFKLNDKIKYQLSALDMLFSVIIILISILFIKRKNIHSLYIFLIFYCIAMILFIGYTIPNAGALLRYKATFITLLLPCLVCLSEIPFLKKYYSIKK